MNPNLFSATKRQPLLYSLFALLIIYFVDGCQGCRNDRTGSNRDNLNNIKGVKSINIVLKKEIKVPSDEEIRAKFNAILDKNGKKISDLIIIKRCPCDPRLINITLPDDYTFEGHDGAVAVKPPVGGSGGGVDLPDYVSIAVNIELSSLTTVEPSDDRTDSTLSGVLFAQLSKDLVVKTEKAVRIAFLDSGFDFDLVGPKKDLKTSTTLCEPKSPKPTSTIGWNFLNSQVSTETSDDQIIKHGTRVALLAAQQFIGSKVPVNVIPMKVLNSENKGDLFSILCALETAHHNNVDIINMSLGYYGERIPIFEEYIKRCTDDNIWIVTAAGNQTNAYDLSNLNSSNSSFYPAKFGETNERVLAVTTVSVDTNKGDGQTCAQQNFSAKFVLGVEEDGNCRFRFSDGNGKDITIFGTSYATPIIAGWLGRKIREKKLNSPEVLMDIPTFKVEGIHDGKVITRQPTK